MSPAPARSALALITRMLPALPMWCRLISIWPFKSDIGHGRWKEGSGGKTGDNNLSLRAKTTLRVRALFFLLDLWLFRCVVTRTRIL